MTRTLLTGATGTLGQELRPRLRAAGHDVRAASRSPPTTDGGTTPDDGTGSIRDGGAADGPGASIEGDEGAAPGDLEWIALDLADGTGVEAAVEDVDVIVHAASAPQGDAEAVDVRGTERLLDAAEDAGVGHVVYVSIVGADEIPFGYYEHKVAAADLVAESDVPETILRATQFHEFVADLLDSVARLPVWPLPTKFRIQPVAAAEVADALVERTSGEPAGRVPPVGGPEVRTAGELAAAYRSARELRRPIVRLPLPGAVASGFRAGEATCPDHAVGTVTWEDWLAERFE